jgi:hypothetical protein
MYMNNQKPFFAVQDVFSQKKTVSTARSDPRLIKLLKLQKFSQIHPDFCMQFSAVLL